MHLSDEQFVLALEGEAPLEVRAHVEACHECRTMLEAARRVWDTVAAVEVPEPSPLFWDHLSARVRAEIDRKPAQETPVWRRWLALPWSARPGSGWGAVATVLGVAVVVTAVAMRPSAPLAPDGLPARTMTPEPAADVELAAVVGGVDEPWELMVDVAADAEFDQSALGLTAGPLDQAWEELSDEERGEVATWLREELAASPRGGAALEGTTSGGIL